MDEILASIFRNQWLVFTIIGLLLLALAEAGFRVGLRLFVTKDEPRKVQIGGIQGAVLGMLALLLGFTFSMALARYENRRDLVLKEANAIGTTYLRASFLPQPHAKAVEELLRRYTDARLSFDSAGRDSTKIAAAEDEAGKLQRELWVETVAAGKEAPTPITATFINALNETIDLDATRLHALRSRVPGAVWLPPSHRGQRGLFCERLRRRRNWGADRLFRRDAAIAHRGGYHPHRRFRSAASRFDQHQPTTVARP